MEKIRAGGSPCGLQRVCPHLTVVVQFKSLKSPHFGSTPPGFGFGWHSQVSAFSAARHCSLESVRRQIYDGFAFLGFFRGLV